MGPDERQHRPFLDESPGEELALEAAREAFPEVDIIEVFGGYLAVPSGVQIVQASTLGGLTGKLRRLPEG